MAEPRFRAACVQLCSGKDIAQNIADASGLILKAAADGAQFISTPETTHFMDLSSKGAFANTVAQDEDPGVAAFAALAADLNIWLHIGSLAIRIAEDKIANRAFVFAPDGSITATYDKVHMFDVDLADGESYRESKNYQAGEEAVLVELPWARLGLAICYDLRFPYLFRALAHAGANILVLPAAFTQKTGEAHWHALLKARAIENGSFVLAAAQGGKHDDGRRTYGHSLIISPWGEILAEAGVEPGVISAEIDLSAVSQARAAVPSLQHDRDIHLKNA